MSSSEYDDILKALESAHESFERMSLEQKLPDPKREREFDKLRKATGEALEQAKELARRQRDDRHLARILREMHKSNTSLLTAIDANAATTNELLLISNARLTQLEQELVNGADAAFAADPNVLAEGEFLKAQLGGVQGTEDPRPLFKDAILPPIVGGLDVLSLAVCERCDDDVE